MRNRKTSQGARAISASTGSHRRFFQSYRDMDGCQSGWDVSPFQRRHPMGSAGYAFIWSHAFQYWIALRNLGWYWPILCIRTIAALTFSFFALWRTVCSRHTERIIPGTPTKRIQLTPRGIGLAMLVGLLEMTGLLIYSLDTQLASTSLASALSSSWGIFPLLAGIVLFRERLPLQ